MAKKEDRELDSWQNCPPGTLGQVARQVTISKRRRNALKIMSVVAPLLLLVGVALKYYPAPGNYPTPDIGCGRAYGMFNAYLDNQLTEAELKQFDRHLAGCAKCTQALESLKESRSAVAVRVSSGMIRALLLISIFCPQSPLAD